MQSSIMQNIMYNTHLFLLKDSQLDSLIISALKVSTRIGVHEWEQKINQQLLIDIAINADLSACEDTLAKTIDYAALCLAVTNLVESRSFQLIETVANTVAQLIKEEFHVETVTVSVNKPHAIKNAGKIEVVVTR